MYSSKKKISVIAAVLAVGAVHCNLPTGLPGNGSSGNGTTNVSYAYSTDIQLPLLPESAWTANGGTINPVCGGGANPRETGFSQVGSGVSIATASNRADCCTCAARSRAFPIARAQTQGSHLHGTVVFARGQSDVYSVASMRVTVKDGGNVVASRVIAAEQRPNNCAGSSELPEVMIDANDDFDVDLGAIAGGKSFDEVDVDLMGYACTVGSNEATLEDLHVLTGSAPAPAPAPTQPAPSNGTPGLASSITPSQWGSYASGTIGKDNSGIATIVNNGTATAKGITVDLHTESNNPYGPVAPFRSVDPRCISSTAGNNGYTCMLADLAPGASTTLAFTFNSFSDTTVVVIAKDTNGDVDFADNRAVGHVYPQ